MPEMKIYEFVNKFNKMSKGIFIIEYEFNDKFKSKRYYLLINKQFNRIKDIDKLIEYCELNDIDLVEHKLSKEQRTSLFYEISDILNNQYLKEMDLINKFNIKDYQTIQKQYMYKYSNKTFNDLLENLDYELDNYDFILNNQYLKEMDLINKFNIKDYHKKK